MAETGERVNHHCQVLIVGGGMAGASLALALSRHAPDMSVAVVESAPITPDVSPHEQYQPSYDRPGYGTGPTGPG
jgi:2-polyprenyl-6-methoxyphenol hydroxylase and related FAD-dependent oxidoreductases